MVSIYLTRVRVCHCIREAVKDIDHSELLSGIVECDEAFIGGNPKTMYAKRIARLGRVPGTMRFDHKTAVLGALQRDGDVRLEVFTVKNQPPKNCTLSLEPSSRKTRN